MIESPLIQEVRTIQQEAKLDGLVEAAALCPDLNEFRTRLQSSARCDDLQESPRLLRASSG